MRQVLLATMVLAAACVARADMTDAISFQSGSLTATLTDGEVTAANPGACTGNGCSVFQFTTIAGTHVYDRDAQAGTITLGTSKINLFNGWLITVTAGDSNSPGLDPYGLDLNLTITCDTKACVGVGGRGLNLGYSDENFTTSASTLETSYSGVITGNSSTTSTAYSSKTNKLLFAETTLIGEDGPFTTPGAFAGTAVGGAFPRLRPILLTLTDLFEANKVGASFSTDLDITGFTPLLLFRNLAPCFVRHRPRVFYIQIAQTAIRSTPKKDFLFCLLT